MSSDPVNPEPKGTASTPEGEPQEAKFSGQTPPEPQAPEAPKIVGYCRACGKALDQTTVRTAQGTIFCEQHVPANPALWTAPPFHGGQYSGGYQPPSQPYITPQSASYANPAYPNPAYPGQTAPNGTPQQPLQPVSPADRSASPGVAFLLGLIPGVGAVYNGQYAKGILHVVILGLLISIVSSGAARGLDPLFGILIPCFWFYMAFEAFHTAKKRRMGVAVDEFSSIIPMGHAPSRFPVFPVVLIAVGILFLLDNLDILELRRAMRYWPALLIVLGCYLLYIRVTDPLGWRERRAARRGHESPYGEAARDMAADERADSNTRNPPGANNPPTNIPGGQL